MEANCLQLSMEGERLLKAGDYTGAIDFFEAGLRAGTQDREVLAAIYNQLGNAYFYVKKYNKALEYHKMDLDLAEKLHDKIGMVRAVVVFVVQGARYYYLNIFLY
jgi:tetratricopeptide (TPR) repeat protein